MVGFLQPIQTANQQAIKALGRSDITLKLEVVKKLFGVVLLLTVMRFGVFAIAASNILYSFVVLIMNSSPNMKLMNYSLKEQIVDIIPNLFISTIMGVIVYLLGTLPFPTIVILMIQVIVGALVFVLESIIFKVESFSYITRIVLNIKK